MNAQEIVVANVAARGYRDGWTAEQFVARQLAKLSEELGEAILHTFSPRSQDVAIWQDHAYDAGLEARKAFDIPKAWEFVWINDLDAIRSELADMLVVLFSAAAALDFDVVQAAIDKSSADVARGVR